MRITKKDLEWIEKAVDGHKHIRAEGTRLRVKLLMLAAMGYMVNKSLINKKKWKKKQSGKQ